MESFRLHQALCCLCMLVLANGTGSSATPAQINTIRFPYPERLTYHVEWRLVTAGSATIRLARSKDLWQTNLDIQSAGLVNRLYRVLDSYEAVTTDKFCLIHSVLDAQEAKRHRVTRLTFERSAQQINYEDHDLTRDTTTQKQTAAAPCSYEVLGALQALRETNLQPGKTTSLPVTDGKKMVNVRIEAQSREKLSLAGKTYATTKYEAFLFDNVLYRRKARLFLWLTDDAERVPVQMRIQLGFPLGNISLLLDQQEKL